MENYLQAAGRGEKLAHDHLDELLVTDVFQFIEDLNKNDVTEVLCRIYYAGYASGYNEARQEDRIRSLDDFSGTDLEIQE